MRDFRSLAVWEKAHALTTDIYLETRSFPKEELYALTSQIRRSSSSIPTNIAEGCGRGSNADFKRFLQIAFGSASETEYLLILSKDLKYIQNERYTQMHNAVEEVKKMLASLMQKINNNH